MGSNSSVLMSLLIWYDENMKNYRLVFREVDHDKFNEIVSGQKTIETRAATIKYKSVQAGDTLTFVCGKDIIIKHVIKVEHFNSLDEMFNKLPLASILPSAQDKNDAENIYFGFPGYKEKIEAEGILAFSLSS